MIRPKRKQLIQQFSLPDNYASIIFLGLFLICGLFIVLKHSVLAVAAYAGLWVISYPVIYAGTCRYCVYYGKKCSIPLEGSCVHKFFEKKEETFGLTQLFWATTAYGFRVALPIFFIFKYSLIGWGIAYFSLLTVFWITHLRFTGCPNCMNTQCPLNPDYTFNTSTRR